MMKSYGLVFALLMALAIPSAFAAENQVDFYSASKLQEMGKMVGADAHSTSVHLLSHPLQTYSNDYTQMVYRDASGQAELHQHYSDLYVVVAGDATLLSGGTLVDPQTIREGEQAAKTIDGGHSQALAPGDVVHIQPNTPHQLLLQAGHSFSYFVLKVKE